MGIPNVGKTKLLLELKNDPRFYIPLHTTNRPRRIDDTNFYKFRNKEYFLKNDMFISVGDTNNRYYGVCQKDINKEKKRQRILTINCSIKNLPDLLENTNKQFICLLLSRNIDDRIYSSKYSKSEQEYRYIETINEQKIVSEYVPNKVTKVYYIEDFSNFDEMYLHIIKDIEEYFFDCNTQVCKKIKYTLKKEYVLDYVDFLNMRDRQIKKFSMEGCCYKYQYIKGRRMSLDSRKDFLDVLTYIESMEAYKENRFISTKDRKTILLEIIEHIEFVKNKKTFFFNKEWQDFFNSNLSKSIELIDTFKNEKMYLSHGDLHYKNILIHDKKIYFIDYEEVAYTPLFYDRLVYIYRYINNIPGMLDEEKIYEILSVVSTNYKYTLRLLRLYCIKVIIQKKFLEVTKQTKIDTWKNDSWILWKNDFEKLNRFAISNCEVIGAE